MKKILLVLAAAVFTIDMYAQTSDAEAQAIVNLLGVQKKEAIAKLVLITGKDSVAFWKLYDDYQKKNIQLAKSRYQLYEKTALSYGNMHPQVADSLARKYFDNRLAQEKSPFGASSEANTGSGIDRRRNMYSDRRYRSGPDAVCQKSAAGM